MSPEDLIQLMRSCNLAQVRAALEHLQNADSKNPDSALIGWKGYYEKIEQFYRHAFTQPK